MPACSWWVHPFTGAFDIPTHAILRDIRPGHLALIYHTDDERQAAGLAEITSERYLNPKAGDPRLVVVDVKPLRRLALAGEQES
jgi:predicted RNA-binding protein with PUA-like domain